MLFVIAPFFYIYVTETIYDIQLIQTKKSPIPISLTHSIIITTSQSPEIQKPLSFLSLDTPLILLYFQI